MEAILRIIPSKPLSIDFYSYFHLLLFLVAFIYNFRLMFYVHKRPLVDMKIIDNWIEELL